MNFRYLHGADIHLDRSLNGLRAGETCVDLQLAPRLAFAKLVDEAIRVSAAFLLLSGDIYDGAWKDSTTGFFFNAQMGRLRQAGIPVYVVYGNHDAQSAMPKTVHPPDNVHVFRPDAAHTFLLDTCNVALHGRSFARVDVRENLVSGYPPPVPGRFNIGLLHTALEGSEPHAPYAPCTVEQLQALGYDYWALGHVHGYRVVSQEPWIVFPGNLQGLHVNEPGARGAMAISVKDGRIQSVEQVFVDVLRWCKLTVDLAGVADLADAWRRVGVALHAALTSADGRHLCARVTLTGVTPLHAWLHVHPQQIDDEVLAQAAGLSEGLSIECVRVATRDPDGDVPVDHGDALGDLQGYLDEAARDPDFIASLRDLLAPVLLELPQVDAELHPEIARVRAGELEALALAKKQELLYRIRES
jgi:hypothetical protein